MALAQLKWSLLALQECQSVPYSADMTAFTRTQAHAHDDISGTRTDAEAGANAGASTIRLEAWACLAARLALGAAFLSAVASRFGLWDGAVDLDHFARFTRYTAEVNAFLPPAAIPFLAWAATLAESICGIALIAGIRVQWAALASAILLALFGTAMTVSLGIKSPLDYSVFSASTGALLLALCEARRAAGSRIPAGAR